MPDVDKETTKQAIKEAIAEFIEKKAAEFGWWSVKTVGALVLGAAIYLWFASHGFEFKP